MPQNQLTFNFFTSIITDPNLNASTAIEAQNIFELLHKTEINKIGLVSDIYNALIHELGHPDVNQEVLGIILCQLNDQADSILSNMNFKNLPGIISEGSKPDLTFLHSLEEQKPELSKGLEKMFDNFKEKKTELQKKDKIKTAKLNKEKIAKNEYVINQKKPEANPEKESTEKKSEQFLGDNFLKVSNNEKPDLDSSFQSAVHTWQKGVTDAVSFTENMSNCGSEREILKKPVKKEKVNCLYIGGNDGSQKKINIKTGNIITDLGIAHEGQVKVVTRSHDNQFIFTGDSAGYLKQWKSYTNFDNPLDSKTDNVQKELLIKDFGHIHENGIIAMAVTYDNSMLFTCDEKSFIKVWDIEEGKIIRNLGKKHDFSIGSIALSYDDEYLFTGDKFGFLKQWSVESYRISKNYGKAHDYAICSICVSMDSRWQFSSELGGVVKAFNIPNKELAFNFGVVHHEINSITTTNDGYYLFTSDNLGNLKQWWTKNDGVELVGDFERAHKHAITNIVASNDSRHLFTSDINGCVKQWRVEDFGFIKDLSNTKGDGITQSMANVNYKIDASVTFDD